MLPVRPPDDDKLGLSDYASRFFDESPNHNSRTAAKLRFAGQVTVELGSYDDNGCFWYMIRVIPVDGPAYQLQKRYRDFARFRDRLPKKARTAVRFPSKLLSLCGRRLSQTQLQQRCTGLGHFMSAIVRASCHDRMHQLRDNFLSPANLSCQPCQKETFCAIHPKVRIREANCFGFFGYYQTECQFCRVAEKRRRFLRCVDVEKSPQIFGSTIAASAPLKKSPQI